ncbi:AAA family ATPase [Mangrovibrevibacter kandeliae]|uniref:AAA family ATPase n=1 Tax=Mangrovibrevibacter kandeliae TaxID=2968473 RepID=UPI0021174611|nr:MULTISPECIES: CtpF protein [unclassified Aurantimonas]MCQ8784103.1 CtpF protein [Aurantimonas sp. CSK15Z-1]MCW4116822.1 CtpF protein [Aurantimonas sp. MSK8Z-1]
MSPKPEDSTPASRPSETAPGSIVIPQITIGAFCETSGVANAAGAAASDRRMQRTRMSVQMGGLPAAIELYRSSPTPNLIIAESSADEATLFGQLEALAEHCLTSTRVLVVGHRNDVTLFRDLLERGVSDYVVAPVDVVGLVGTIARLYRESGAQRLGKLCAFIGTRGGAGSSTVAHNTAFAIAGEVGRDVLLADLDLPFGTVGLDFNIEAPHGILDAIHEAGRLDDVLLDRLMTMRTERLNLLTPPLALGGAYDLRETEFDELAELARSSARLTVLDLPHMWTSWVRRRLIDADEVVITATPDLASMRNLKGILEFLKNARPHDAPPKLVLNQIGLPKRAEIKPAAFAEAVGLQLQAEIAFDAKLFGGAANNGQMIGEVAPRSSPARAFAELGLGLVVAREAKVERRGLKRLLKR